LANTALSLYKLRKELILALIRAGFQVYISTPKDLYFEHLQSLGANIIVNELNRHGTSLLQEYGLYRAYHRLVKGLKPDIVLTYTIKPNIYGNMAAKKVGVPVISTITGLGEVFINDNMRNSFIKIMYRHAFKHVSCVMFQNAEDEEILRRLKIIKRQRVVRVPGSGVNLEEHSVLPFLENSVVSFLYIGRIMRAKGIGLLIDAARRLNDECPGAFKVTLIGFHEGDIADEVGQAEKEGVVHDAGFQEDVVSFIREAHCIVLPSYKEGMSNVLLEAAASGRPLISANVSGCREIVEDGVNGFICKPRDSTSLYVAMKRFLHLPYSQRVDMGLASRRKAEIEFDRSIVIETMLKEIKEAGG